MNGINIMACVQTNQPGFPSVYGRESRMQQKYIRISRQTGLRSAVSRTRDPITGEGMSKAACGPDRSAAGGKGCTSQSRAQQAGMRQAGRKAVQNSSRRSRASAGRRASSFALRTLVLAVIFAGMLAGFQMMTRASSREKEPTYKYYTTVTIGYGEDLSDIVFRYCDSNEYESADAYVRELCEINSLPYHKGSVPDLKAGARIVIPYYSAVLK